MEDFDKVLFGEVKTYPLKMPMIIDLIKLDEQCKLETPELTATVAYMKIASKKQVEKALQLWYYLTNDFKINDLILEAEKKGKKILYILLKSLDKEKVFMLFNNQYVLDQYVYWLLQKLFNKNGYFLGTAILCNIESSYISLDWRKID